MKNKIFNYVILTLFFMTSVGVLSKSVLASSKTTETKQFVCDTGLSQQEIIQFLYAKFATIKFAADINVPLIARSIYNKSDITQVQLEEIIVAAQKLAFADSSGVISRKHISAILFSKLDARVFCLVYLFLNKRRVAVHEAGHAVAIVYLLRNIIVLNEVTVARNAKVIGYAEVLYRRSKNNIQYYCPTRALQIDYYKKSIIMSFCGGIAEQIFAQPEYTRLYDVFNYTNWFNGKRNSIAPGLEGILSSHGCSHDIKKAEEYAQILIDYKLTKQTKEEILIECYYQAYEFMLKHIVDVDKLANILMQQDVVFGSEVYELLGIERPLFDFEEPITPVQKKQWSWRWKK